MAFLAVFAAVAVGIALFILGRRDGGRILLSIAGALIGIVLFLSPIVGAGSPGPFTLSETEYLYQGIGPAFLMALIALAAALVGADSLLTARHVVSAPRWPQMAFFGVAVVAFLSLLWQWLARAHGQPVYLDVMLQGFAYPAALVVLAWVASQVAANRAVLYGLVLSLVAGAGIASGFGDQHYLIQWRQHNPTWREFATSTNPDFFACFLVLTLPLTLALWLGAPAGNARRIGLLYGLIFFLQLFGLAVTASRFALISAPVGFCVLGAGYLVSRRRGMAGEPATHTRLLILAALVLLGGVFAVRPVLHRFGAGILKDQAHSGAFRVWTWKGEAKLIKAHPALGTGPGTFVYAYPKYALVGFTQLAHDSYLQLAGDTGIPNLLLLLAGFGGVVFLGARAFSQPLRASAQEPDPPVAAPKKKGRAAAPAKQISSADSFLDQVAPSDDRWLLAGLLGSMIGGLIQNLIDSDLYLFFNGVTLLAIAGFILALAGRQTESRRPARPMLIAITAFCAVLFFGMFWSGVAISYAYGQDYQTAESMAPLNATYASLLASRVYLPQGDTTHGVEMFIRSNQLAPDAVTCSHLGDLYLYLGQPAKAADAFTEGLRYDPNSLQLLLKAAKTADALGRHSEALGYWGKMADLQQGPYAHVLAITEVNEYRYAYADSALGDQAMAERNFPAALQYFQTAQAILELYAKQGGSRNPMRLAENNGQPNPDVDQSLQQLYEHVMSQMESIDEQSGKPDQAAALRAQAASYIPKFVA